MYNWRKMTAEKRNEVLHYRMIQKLPLHSLPHTVTEKDYFHIAAACFEHKSIIGKNPERMFNFESKLLETIVNSDVKIIAYVVLPNHYHVLLKPESIKQTLKAIFKLHQATGFYWNKEDEEKGRKVWFNVLDSGIKSERHFWATVNYIHNNPTKHGYVNKWQEWPFSSAAGFIEREGYEKTKSIWENYDTSDMCKWDI